MKKEERKMVLKFAEESDNPADFIRYTAALQMIPLSKVAEKAGIKTTHLYVILSQIRRGQGMTIPLIIKISEALDIDPNILNRVIADYSIKMHLKTNKV